MSTRERILTIRLMDKISKKPEYAKALGIEVRQDSLSLKNRTVFDRTEE